MNRRIIHSVLSLSIGAVAVAAFILALSTCKLAYSAEPDWTFVESASWEAGRLVITQDVSESKGAAWYSETIDFNDDFDFEFLVYLGQKNEDGGEGIVFVFAPSGTADGIGEGLGYQGMFPSLAIEIDTHTDEGEYLFGSSGDAANDHMAFDYGGLTNHRRLGLQSVDIGEIEDGAEHSLRITWSAEEAVLNVYLDDSPAPVLAASGDLAAKYIGAPEDIRLGITGSTGEVSNLQYVVPMKMQIGTPKPEPEPEPEPEPVIDSEPPDIQEDVHDEDVDVSSEGMEWMTIGSAFIGDDRFVITPDYENTDGAVWYEKEIDLANDFSFEFKVYLGEKDDDGAEGMVFVLASEKRASTSGESLGYRGIAPSLGIEVDTNPNDGRHTSVDFGDPLRDHIAVVYGGNNNHLEILGTISQVHNLEDGQEHSLRIVWTSGSKTMSVFLDGAWFPALVFVDDIVEKYLGGDSTVYFGITGSTGAASNLQYVIPVEILAG